MTRAPLVEVVRANSLYLQRRRGFRNYFLAVFLSVMALSILNPQSVSAENFEQLKARFLKLRNVDPEYSQPEEWGELDHQITEFLAPHLGHASKVVRVPDAVAEGLLFRSVIAELQYVTNADPALLDRSHSHLEQIVQLFPGDFASDEALLRRIALLRRYADSEQEAVSFAREVALKFPDTPAGDAAAEFVQASQEPIQEVTEPEAVDPDSSARASLAVGAPLVVIDPGHGGEDTGAKGVHDLLEKDVTYSVAMELAQALRDSGNFRVALTREGDQFVPLKDRATVANQMQGNVLISLHANASEKRTRRGLELYYFDHARDSSILSLVARENGPNTSSFDTKEVGKWLSAMSEKTKQEESVAFGRILREQLLNETRNYWEDASALGPRRAPFYILKSVQMPAVLVELLFIDHPGDAGLVVEPEFRKSMVKAMEAALNQYFGIQ